MLRKTRIIIAIAFFGLITLTFLDFTGVMHAYFGWMEKVQLLPAVLAANAGIIIGLAVLALVFGRIYCSAICPLGVFQDIVSRLNRKKNRFRYSPAANKLRIAALVVFIPLLAFPATAFAARLIAPYSAYGRIAYGLFAPVYKLGNNALAYFAERIGSYAFYSVDVWTKSAGLLAVAAATFVVVAVLAWRNGRAWCNTVCPVGTALGFLSKFSLFKVRIDSGKCNKCGLCARNCKSSCIDSKGYAIDYSRCVACGDCIGKCSQGAIKYAPASFAKPAGAPAAANGSRRGFLIGGAALLASSLAKAQDKMTDGGLADIEDKKEPARKTQLAPPGSLSARNFASHCTACQLCVSACPNNVLSPSSKLAAFMQPEMSYGRGYCRPECTKCSEVCPSGAIRPITKEEKTAVKIGTALWVAGNCIVNRDEVQCGNCARHCPNGAISMVAVNPDDKESLKIPSIDAERCIGCGACEYVCPSRPLSAIYVDGLENHRSV